MNSPSHDFELTRIPRPRWNVLDVMAVATPHTLPVPMVFDIDVSWAEKLRARYLELGHKISFTAILLKAISIAQREHPLTRTHAIPLGKLVTMNRICSGFTVEREVDGTPAVFFGTIKNSDSKPLIEIARELRSYAQDDMKSIPQLNLQMRSLDVPGWVRRFIMHMCVWSPRLRQKLIPATFGISSVGKWGCKTGTPPSLCTTTFGVGEVEERPVVVNRQVHIRPMVTLTYVFDHKILDGGPACRFMKDVTDLLQGGMETYVAEELELLAGARLRAA